MVDYVRKKTSRYSAGAPGRGPGPGGARQVGRGRGPAGGGAPKFSRGAAPPGPGPFKSAGARGPAGANPGPRKTLNIFNLQK